MARRRKWSILNLFGFWGAKRSGGARRHAVWGLSDIGNGGAAARWAQPRGRRGKRRTVRRRR